MRLYNGTSLNRSCSKEETLLNRTDTFDPISLLYAFLSRISKAKHCIKRTLLQTDNIFSPQIKKHSALRGHKTFRNSRETENYIGHFCQFSQKETFFYTSKQHFFISICSFEGVQHFWLELAIFYSKLLSATNQQLFLRHWKRYRPSNHIAPRYRHTSDKNLVFFQFYFPLFNWQSK